MPEAPAKKPNVLILMSDEHRADVSGFAGDKVIRTPNLDWLAETGAVFNNAYTPSPVCIPARQSIMAGQYPRTTGCEHFHQDLSPEYMTYSRRFTQYGYNTVCAGKLHHRGTDQLQGWMSRIGGDIKLNAEFTERLVSNQKSSNESMKWSDAKEIARAGIGCGPHQDEDQYVLQGALNFIKRFFIDSEYDCATPDDPLMLKVSFCRPHYPYFTDKERFEYYLNRVEPFSDQLVANHPWLSMKSITPGSDASERDIRRAVAAYYGMIDSLDNDFGKIFDALRFAGQDLDDWIIVYMSDHGEMLGEHGVWEKFKFYEGSARVPLVIRWPRGFKGGQAISENVNLCDLFASLCDLCHIPIPEGLDSRSLGPLLNADSSVKWNNYSYSEFNGDQLMIKRDSLKYQWFGPDIPEVLFDLERDPSETVDVINDPAYGEVLGQLREECRSRGFGVSEVGYSKSVCEPTHAN